MREKAAAAFDRGRRNRLLAQLCAGDYEALAADAVLTSLAHLKSLYPSGAPVDAVYFPLDCIVAVLAGGGEGEPMIEIATVGNEGVIGVFSILAAERPIGTNVVRFPGDAVRLSITAFQKHIGNSRLGRLIDRYLYAFTHQIVQTSACDRLHSMEQRCARWLLMMRDRMENNTFPLTQESLSEMLGVRRATVNLAIGSLRTAGFVQYVRGQVTIANREGLESAACPCYERIRREFDRLGAE